MIHPLPPLLLVTVTALLMTSSVGGHDVSEAVLGSFRQFLPAAFGDYNGDKQTDMFVLDQHRHSLEILLAQRTETPMMRRNGLRCEYPDLVIESVVPSDFDGDGAMDVLVVAREANVAPPSHDLTAFVLWGDTHKLNCARNESISIALRGQPLAVDYDGDMVTDLFGQSRNGSRTFWLFGRDRRVRRVVLDHADSAPLRLPSANAFVDVNGDLTADLVIATVSGYETWVHADAGWALAESLSLALPPGAAAVGQSAFFDIDSDGVLEHLVPVCFDSSCKNSSLLVAQGNGTWTSVLLETEDSVNGQWGFVPPSDDVYRESITPRVGDYNLDGFPDLLMSLERKDGQVGPQKTFLLRSVPCNTKPACRYPRGFRAEWDTFAGYADSPAAAFYDLSDDGLLDAFVVHRVDGDYMVSAEHNSADYDALFLKVIVLDGGCFSNCSYGIHIPYGTNKPGPALRGRMTLVDGSLWSFAAAQLSRSGHHALQLPYTVFGLGRSPNFVDELVIGVPRVAHAPGPLTKQWTQLIPNSQMIVVPHPPVEPSRWVSKLYVTPGQTILATLIALLGTLALTLVVIGLLHWREKRQDRRERMQEAHRFNFDAM